MDRMFHQMKAEVNPPEFLFHPEDGGHHLDNIAAHAGFGPQAEETVQRPKVRSDQMGGVVPDDFAVPGRLISEKRRDDQKQFPEPVGIGRGFQTFAGWLRRGSLSSEV